MIVRGQFPDSTTKNLSVGVVGQVLSLTAGLGEGAGSLPGSVSGNVWVLVLSSDLWMKPKQKGCV